MLDIIQKFKTQLIIGSMSVALLATGGALLVAKIENRQLVKANTSLDTKVTGLQRDVAQAETNTEQLKTAITDQKRQWEAKAAQDAAVLAETKRRLVEAQTASRVARSEAAKILATPPQGDTLDARVRDVDARILETLK